MKPFRLIPAVVEYADFAHFAEAESLGMRDLILTNEYIYEPTISALNLGCQTLFQEKFGGGEPTDTMVDAILNALQGTDYDRIIAVGGGTVIDIAKAICVAEKKDDVDALYEHMTELKRVHSLYIVPTTCGTGSEVTNISIINRTRRGIKLGLVAPAMYAEQAVLVPSMLDSLPYVVFATSSIDALVHAVESYLSPNACVISEMFSERAISMLLHCWQHAVETGDKNTWKSYAAEFLRASNFAGIAFGHAGCAAVHALSYPLGGVHHIPHGQANQLMFAPVMLKYQEKNSSGKFATFEKLLGRELGIEPTVALEKLIALIDTVLERAPLREHGICESELPVFAQSVLESQQRLLGNNYVPLTEADILAIYRSAY